MIFFIGYLLVGLFFLLNVLLAVVFENYKKRLEERVTKRGIKRVNYIEKYYSLYDPHDKGFLSVREAKKFFALVLDLDYKDRKDRTAFKKIMKVVDPDSEKFVYKENIVHFFSMPGFIDIIKPQEEDRGSFLNMSKEDDEELSDGNSASDVTPRNRTASYYDVAMAQSIFSDADAAPA